MIFARDQSASLKTAVTLNLSDVRRVPECCALKTNEIREQFFTGIKFQWRGSCHYWPKCTKPNDASNRQEHANLSRGKH